MSLPTSVHAQVVSGFDSTVGRGVARRDHLLEAAGKAVGMAPPSAPSAVDLGFSEDQPASLCYIDGTFSGPSMNGFPQGDRSMLLIVNGKAVGLIGGTSIPREGVVTLDPLRP
ncbi:MAG: hypothetical protein U0Q22_14510 [Acidimicrobiales bacterium]